MPDARKPKPPRRRPGFEPARGFPDPMAPKPQPTSDVQETHMPHRNGSVCGEAFTESSSYTQERPTCPQCRTYFDAIQKTAVKSPSAGTPAA